MMKKILLTIITLLALSIGVNAQNVNIPDANFKAYLVGNTAINTNGDTEIQVSEASAVSAQITCQNQSISDLTGIEAFTALTSLNCSNNSLSSLDVTQNTALTSLSFNNNSLTSIDVSQNTALTTLFCLNNSLSSLILNQNTALLSLNCNGNALTSLDLSQNTSLTGLYCNSNSLTSLDVSQNTSLTSLYCNSNSLTSIDITLNTDLTAFSCTHNFNLNTIDVSQNVNLIELFVNATNLGALDVSQNTNLTRLDCYDNQLSSLDVSANTALTDLTCSSNNLTSLNVANGNNSNFTWFRADNNPNLTCIQVDDVAWSTTNWTFIDATASFSTNCVSSPVLVNSISVQGQNGVSTITTNNGTLQMEATVLPANADDATYTWSVANGTGSASISATGLLAASANGTVTVKATANDGSGVSGSEVVTISNQGTQNILVNSIVVDGQNGVSTISTNGGTLQMEASVLPANADDATYAWSVNNSNASISATGILTALANGTVEVTATANDASGITGTKTITISNQSVGINDFSFESLNIYPNPTSDILNLEIEEELSSIRIMDLTGKTIKEFNAEAKQLDISELTSGIYFLEIANAEKKSVLKIVKR